MEKSEMTMHMDLNEDSTIQCLLEGNVSEDFKKALKETFKVFDADGDGKVTTKELSTIIRSLGILSSDCEINAVLSTLDTDGNGTVEYSEFEEFMLTRDHVINMADDTDVDMMNAFKLMDKNGDGFITRDELKTCLTKVGDDPMTDAEADELIKDFDKDGNGKIDYSEYRERMQMQL